MIIPIIDLEATGRRLKALCMYKGISVEHLRVALGLESVQSCYKWFAGKNLPSIDNLIILSQLFGVPINDLIVVENQKVDL